MDNFYRNCQFLGITPADVFFKATEDYDGDCKAVDYSVEVDYDSPAGKDMHMAQFRVVFLHNGELTESFPSFNY